MIMMMIATDLPVSIPLGRGTLDWKLHNLDWELHNFHFLAQQRQRFRNHAQVSVWQRMLHQESKENQSTHISSSPVILQSVDSVVVRYN